MALYPTSGTLAGMPPRPVSPALLNIPTSPALTAPTAPRFTAPTLADMMNDPGYQFRVDEGQRGIERSAAAHGTLLSGGTLKSLERYRQGLASQEAGNVFDRALSTYNANANAGLGYGRLGLDTAEMNNANAWRTAGADQANRQGMNDYNAAENDWAQADSDRLSSDYAAQVMAMRPGTLGGLPRAPRRAIQRNMGGVEYRDLA